MLASKKTHYNSFVFAGASDNKPLKLNITTFGLAANINFIEFWWFTRSASLEALLNNYYLEKLETINEELKC